MKPDGNAGAQGSVHPAPAGDFNQSSTQGCIKVTVQLDLPFNYVDPLKCGFPALVLRRFLPVVAEPDANMA